jgi:hypothetical protein
MSIRSCYSQEQPSIGCKRDFQSWESKTPRPTLGRFAVKKQRNDTGQRHPLKGDGTEFPQARDPICARIKATNSLARV